MQCPCKRVQKIALDCVQC